MTKVFVIVKQPKKVGQVHAHFLLITFYNHSNKKGCNRKRLRPKTVHIKVVEKKRATAWHALRILHNDHTNCLI